MGFVFYPKKAGGMFHLKKAAELRRNLKPAIKNVGVFVNLPVEQVCDIVRIVNLILFSCTGMRTVSI